VKVDIDDGLFADLEALARVRRRTTEQLLNQAVDALLKREKNPPVTAAPKGYGLRPEEKKKRA
jgi:hypothetical protein